MNESLRRLLVVKRTELEMVRDRGVDVSTGELMVDGSFTPVDLSFMLDPSATPESRAVQSFRDETGYLAGRESFTALYPKHDASGNVTGRLLVVYLTSSPGKKVSRDHFQLVNAFVLEGYKQFVLVSENGLNADAKSQITSRMPSCKFETFLDVELAFNPTKHSLAPIRITHVPSSGVSEWAEKERVTPTELPLILETDIIARWYGARPYDVFQSELLGTTTDTMGYNRMVRKSNR